MTPHQSFATIVLLALAAGVQNAHAATLKADYQFQGNFTSDVAGAPDLVGDLVSNSFSTDTVNGQSRTVYQFANNNGLTAQTDGVISPINYSIVIYAKLDALSSNVTPPVTANIAKLIDFKNLQQDEGLYNLGNQLDFYNVPTAVGPSVSGLFGTGTYAQLVLTRDAGAVGGPLVTAYVNGSSVFSFVDSGGIGYAADLAVIENLLPSPTGEFLHFFQNDSAGLLPNTLAPESESGSIARLRLYDGALSSSDVAALDTSPVPEPASIALLATGALLMLRRRSPR